MTASEILKSKIKEFDGCKPKKLEVAETFVNSLNAATTQGQFDALVDFAYSLGCNTLGTSDLLRYIYDGRPLKDIQSRFMDYNKQQAFVYDERKHRNVKQLVEMAALTRRRKWEAMRYAQ